MTAMVAATAAVVTAVPVVLGFLSVCVNAGMRLLTRSELFSPTSQSQQQNSRNSEYETLHTDLVESLSQSTGLTLPTGKSFTIGYVLA
jgi:hypothetical protein